jgi:hypothetical protein
MRISYTVGDNGDDKYELDTNWANDNIDYMADDAAKDFHSNHDGWESSWPLDFEIFIEDVSQGVYRVERENSPTFSSTKIIVE